MNEEQTHVVYHRGPSIFEYHAAEGTDRLLVYRVEVRPAWAAPGQFVGVSATLRTKSFGEGTRPWLL